METGVALKQRLAARETIEVGAGWLGMGRDELAARLREPVDLLFVDAQHSPYDDAGFHDFCKLADGFGLPVVLRILHPHQTWSIGHYLDLGALGVVVPMTEDAQTAAAAVEASYYPPLGRRSFGPARALGWAGRSEGHEYAEWWNAHGILILQIETLAGVLNCRELVLPGVDMLVFGANDLTLDLRRHPDAPFDSFEACREQVATACADLPVKVAASDSPRGRL